MLTTDDIVARLQPRRLWRPPRQTFPLATAGMAVVGLCYGAARLVGLGNPGAVAQPTTSVWASLPTAPLAEDLHAEEVASHLTPVTVRLSKPGSVFIDGRRMGMQRQHYLTLAPGPHGVMVRFGTKSFRRSVEVGARPLVITCDPVRGFGHLPAGASPRAAP